MWSNQNYIRNLYFSQRLSISKFKKYRNKLKSLLKAAERFYYAELFASCGNDLIKIWKVIKGILHGYSTETLPSTFTKNGTLVTENINIANNFNENFISVGSNLAANISPLPPTLKMSCLSEPHTPFFMLPTNNDEILSICSNFESKGSAGYDEISSTIAKSTMQCIISPLTDIINCSFETGIIPNDIKLLQLFRSINLVQKMLFPTTALYLFYHTSQRFF